MARSTSSRGSSSRTAFRLTFQTSKERCVRIYWSKKALLRKLAELRIEGSEVLKIEQASVRWIQKVP